MNRAHRLLPVVLAFGLLASACGASRAPSASSGASSQAPVARKQIVASIFSDPSGLNQEVTNPVPSAGSNPGLAELYSLVNGSMAFLDSDNNRQAWFAEAIPSTDNGLWKVFPDGRMETTWKMRPGIKWHDGEPLTSDDVRFTLDVYGDKEVGAVIIPSLALIDGVDTPDAQTIVIKWSKPFIDADAYFGSASPSSGAARIPPIWLLPRHLLDDSFQKDKAGFFGLSYWRESYVGTGPFKVQDWVAGSHAMLVANDDYFQGRPKLDQVEVRFFGDKNALKAALLGDAVQVPMGRGFNVEDVIQMRDGAPNVKVQLSGPLGGVLPIYPQFIDPDPAIVANVQFRRAMLTAIDRQELDDALNDGLGPIAHSWVQPDEPEGRAVDGKIVKYPYDPRAAAQQIESLGYSKNPDGMYQSSDGTPLAIQLLTHEQNSFHVPTALAVLQYWQKLGIDAQLDVLPAPRATDLRYRALFPAFILLSKGVIGNPDSYFTRKAIPLQENNFAGGNAARYGSDEIDSLAERYGRTIPFNDRMAILGDMVHLQTDQVTMLPLFFQGAAFILGSTHMKNLQAGMVTNANQWDLQ